MHYPSNHFLIKCTVTARPARAMEVVRGISFGHTTTQFCALPQCLNATGRGQRFESFGGLHGARGVRVEQHRLADGMGPEKGVTVESVLRAACCSSVSPSSRGTSMSRTAGRPPSSSHSSCIDSVDRLLPAVRGAGAGRGPGPCSCRRRPMRGHVAAIGTGASVRPRGRESPGTCSSAGAQSPGDGLPAVGRPGPNRLAVRGR